MKRLIFLPILLLALSCLGQQYEFPLNEASILNGADLVTNGTFDTDASGWTNTGTWTVNGIELNNDERLYQTLSPTPSLSTQYLVSYDVYSNTFDGVLRIIGSLSHTDNFYDGSFLNLSTNVGHYQLIITTKSSGTPNIFEFRPMAGTTGAIVIDNIVIRELNTQALELQTGTKGTATDIYPCLDYAGSGSRWYEFDGSSSYFDPTITAIGTNDFSIHFRIKKASTPSANEWVFGASGGGGAGTWDVYINTSGYLIARIDGVALPTSTTNIADGVWHDCVLKMDRDGNGAWYIDNGSAEDVTDISSYSSSNLSQTTLYIMRRSSGNYLEGDLACVRVFNSLVDETYYYKPSNPIKYEHTHSDYTTMMDEDLSTSTNWTLNSSSTISGGTLNLFADGTNNQWAIFEDLDPIGITGKSYRVTYTVTANTLVGSGTMQSGNISGNEIAPDPTTLPTTVGTNSVTFTDNRTGNQNRFSFRLKSGFTSGSISIDNITVTPIGSPLNLNSEGVYDNIWLDQLNGISATNNGATAVIPPTSNLGATWFNGATSLVTYTGMDGLTGDVTVIGEILPNNWGENGAGRVFTNGQLTVTLDNGGEYIRLARTGASYASSAGSSITLEERNHFAITSKSDGTTNLYVNGALSGTANQSAGTPSSGTTYYIGDIAAGGRCFDGWIRNLRIDNRIWSLSEIQEDYAKYRN